MSETQSPKDALLAARQAVQDQQRAQEVKEAANDLPHLKAAKAAMADPSVDALVAKLTASVDGMVGPDRVNAVNALLHAVNNVRNSVDYLIGTTEATANRPQ